MQLTARDRITLVIGSVVVVVFLIVQFVFLPVLDKRKRLARKIISHQSALTKMKTMQVEFQQLNQQSSSLVQELSERKAGFSLFSFLEKAADESAVKGHIAYMKPSAVTGEGSFKQVMVEMKLKNIGLQQMVDFLQSVESPKNVVAVKRLSVQNNKKSEGLLDVIVQVISIDKELAK